MVKFIMYKFICKFMHAALLVLVKPTHQEKKQMELFLLAVNVTRLYMLHLPKL